MCLMCLCVKKAFPTVVDIGSNAFGKTYRCCINGALITTYFHFY